MGSGLTSRRGLVPKPPQCKPPPRPPASAPIGVAWLDLTPNSFQHNVVAAFYVCSPNQPPLFSNPWTISSTPPLSWTTPSPFSNCGPPGTSTAANVPIGVLYTVHAETTFPNGEYFQAFSSFQS